MTAPSNRKSATAYTIGAWMVLMVLTAASWWLGVDRTPGGLAQDASMITIIVLTFGKVAVVGHSFMELHGAAPWLSRTFFGWCLALCLALSTLYLAI
jgi:hypothetical protein